jgi:hypothetical protein
MTRSNPPRRHQALRDVIQRLRLTARAALGRMQRETFGAGWGLTPQLVPVPVRATGTRPRRRDR